MKTTLFIIWMFLTVILGLSIIGWVLLFPETFSYQENKPSTWMGLGKYLLHSILENGN